MTDPTGPTEPRENPTSADAVQSIASPCVGVCRIALDACAGCGRTITEIIEWGEMDDASKQATLDRIASAPATLTY